ncbi:MAG: CHAT domain-containing protein [Chloroflexi bacterium]|nr:CHAT domain-containing protein [Chloroflexota bacterium]
MPISPNEINPNWRDFPPTAQVGEVHFNIPRDARRILWIVVPLENEMFAVFKYGDLIQAVKDFTQADEPRAAMLNLVLQDLPGFLSRYARPAVDRETGDIYTIRETWNALSDPPLVVLSNGAIIGVLKSGRRGGDEDADWFGNLGMAQANGGDEPKNGGGEIPVTGEEDDKPKSGGKLEAKDAKPTAPARKINVRFEPPEQKDSPLQKDETYTLVFSVDLEKLAQAIAAADLDETRFFPPNVEQVDIFVQLLSDDFEILTQPQKLIVPRAGKSKNRARFDIVPQKNGVGEITAVFSKDGNAVQAMTLQLNVGVPGQPAFAGSETLGRPIDSAGAAQARGLTLWIDYKGEGFQVNVLDPEGTTSFLIPLQLHELQQAINDARAVLNEIVDWRVNDEPVYQTGIDIPAVVNQATLPKLAEAGYLLFQTIFMHFGLDDTGRAFAARLRALATQETLKIQIISKQMLLPWGILYLAEIFDPDNIKPELFLGLGHIIEHAPMQPKMDFAHHIASQPQLTVSLNLNPEIDAQMNFPLIKNQKKYWDTLKQQKPIQLVTRTNGSDVLNAFANAKTPDQITYFYCHAVSRALGEVDPKTHKKYTPDDSMLQFGANQAVTFKDFRLRAPNSIRLDAAPLIFLNACESAELSPVLYNGFMPYFVDKGARGMIGAECPVPAFFAADWAQKFFDRFLRGQPLGEIFLEMRRDYFYNHRNILGLLYAVYCNADTRVEPALA